MTVHVGNAIEFFDRSAIADKIGALELRVGHRLQFRNSLPKRERWLSTCWDMTFIPSFHKHGTIAVVTLSHLNDDDTATSAETIGVLFSDGRAFSKSLDDDPVLHLFGSIPVSHPPDFSQSRDGRSCWMHITTTALDVRLVFDNPGLIELRRIEMACLRTAHIIAHASGDSKLIECVLNWEQYANDMT